MEVGEREARRADRARARQRLRCEPQVAGRREDQPAGSWKRSSRSASTARQTRGGRGGGAAARRDQALRSVRIQRRGARLPPCGSHRPSSSRSPFSFSRYIATSVRRRPAACDARLRAAWPRASARRHAPSSLFFASSSAVGLALLELGFLVRQLLDGVRDWRRAPRRRRVSDFVAQRRLVGVDDATVRVDPLVQCSRGVRRGHRDRERDRRAARGRIGRGESGRSSAAPGTDL